ncbi:LysR substrate-binding domain-containing protein [Sphingopyxis sp. NJF-3]
MTRADDLILLAHLIEKGSFSRASAAAGVSKSFLSRRIAELEVDLDVRLIERTTRTFYVTDMGRQLYQHACALREAREAALALVDARLAQPTGPLCVVCPVVLAETLIGDIAISYAAMFPEVHLTFDVVSSLPNVLPEHYDITFVPSYGSLPDSAMIARRILRTPYILAAAPGWMAEAGIIRGWRDLQDREGIGWWQAGTKPIWNLLDTNGDPIELHIRPTLQTNNLQIAQGAAVAGLGMARLPLQLCRDDLESGKLVEVLPGVTPRPIIIHVAYPSRRSLNAAGRAFLALLDEKAQDQFRDYNETATEIRGLGKQGSGPQ